MDIPEGRIRADRFLRSLEIADFKSQTWIENKILISKLFVFFRIGVLYIFLGLGAHHFLKKCKLNKSKYK